MSASDSEGKASAVTVMTAIHLKPRRLHLEARKYTKAISG